MTVVNCKVKYIRPKYQNLKEWTKDTNNVYIGRAGIVFINKQRFPKKPSIFANPFKVGKRGTRKEVIQKYKTHITKRIKSEPELRDQLIKLDGKNLGCWCHPELCHGDILLELIKFYVDV